MGALRSIGLLLPIIAVMALIMPGILMRILMTPFFYSDLSKMPKADAALILGASVIRGEPSPVLAARADAGKLLYESGKVSVLILSGAVEPNYDEVKAMREYLLKAGVPESAIVSDEEGRNTYTSVYRARNVFLARSLIIVTQDFHLPRAVFLARAMEIEAYGHPALRGGTLYDYLREIPASWKALWEIISHHVPQQSSTIPPPATTGVALG